MKAKIKGLIIQNSFIKKIALSLYKSRLRRKIKIKLGKGVLIGPSTICEGNNYLGYESSINSSYLGFASYLAENTIIKKAKIGKYVSIGPDVKIVDGKHPSSDFVSTHPAFFSTRKQVGFSYTDKQLFQEFADFRDKDKKYSTIIGNDVWIGARVLIMEGVQIGDGAIVAAGAVVVKDIEPYAIVAGIPAKTIKYRFTKNQIDFLMGLKWWDKEETWIRANSGYFSNINGFIKQFGDAKN